MVGKNKMVKSFSQMRGESQFFLRNKNTLSIYDIVLNTMKSYEIPFNWGFKYDKNVFAFKIPKEDTHYLLITDGGVRLFVYESQ